MQLQQASNFYHQKCARTTSEGIYQQGNVHPQSIGILNPDGTAAQTTQVSVQPSTSGDNGNGNGTGNGNGSGSGSGTGYGGGKPEGTPTPRA